MISGYEKRFKKSKNPYDQFVQPYEEPYVKIYLSKELENIYLFCTPHIVKGYAHGVADMSNIFGQNKFYLLTTFQNKNISEFMTHQEIFNSLKKNDQLKCKSLFDFYENLKFSKSFKISLKNFYLINIKILRYAYFKK